MADTTTASYEKNGAVELNERVSSHSSTDNGSTKREFEDITATRTAIEDEPPFRVNSKVILTIIPFSMAFIGSQLIPLMYASLYSQVGFALDSGELQVWFPEAHSVAVAAVAPFVGSFSDLYGKKLAACIGVLASVIGMVLCAATPNAEGFVAGQAFGGIGIAVQELTAIAAVSEIVPIAKRGYFVGITLMGFLPFAPGSLYGQLISQSSWRYVGAMLAIWHALTLVGIIIMYHPPHGGRSLQRVSTREAASRLDLVGGFLSISGICVFLMGLNWGGYSYAWDSAQVIGAICTGLALCVLFGIWEKFGAKYPLFPVKMIIAPWPFAVIMFVILTAGIGYISILLFWPSQAVAVYGADHLHVGIYTVPYGFCILGGAIMSALLMSLFKDHVQWVMAAFCIMQTAGTGSMAAADMNNINTVWAPMVFGLVGAGGVMVPNQIIVTAITPDEFIGTATALTLSIRAVGQVIGYTLFYNRLRTGVQARAQDIMLPVAIETGILDVELITNVVSAVQAEPWSKVAQGIAQIDTPEKFELFRVGLATIWARSFPLLYYISVAFGGVACIGSVLIGDLGKYMTQHVAVHL